MLADEREQLRRLVARAERIGWSVEATHDGLYRLVHHGNTDVYQPHGPGSGKLSLDEVANAITDITP